MRTADISLRKPSLQRTGRHPPGSPCPSRSRSRKELEMKRLCMSVALAVITILLLGNSSTKAKSDNEPTISAHMVGLSEVPPTASKGVADFNATISSDASTIAYTLQWSGLTTLPLFSHIHSGPTKVN